MYPGYSNNVNTVYIDTQSLFAYTKHVVGGVKNKPKY